VRCSPSFPVDPPIQRLGSACPVTDTGRV